MNMTLSGAAFLGTWSFDENNIIQSNISSLLITVLSSSDSSYDNLQWNIIFFFDSWVLNKTIIFQIFNGNIITIFGIWHVFLAYHIWWRQSQLFCYQKPIAGLLSVKYPFKGFWWRAVFCQNWQWSNIFSVHGGPKAKTISSS